jgi:uncharacterized lipoprotein YbaY
MLKNRNQIQQVMETATKLLESLLPRARVGSAPHKQVSGTAVVTPAKARAESLVESGEAVWIPAFAGMTVHLSDTSLNGFALCAATTKKTRIKRDLL